MVKQVDAFDKTESGIFIPSQAQEAQAKGTVVHVGTGTVYDQEQIFKAGQEVLFQKGRGYKMEVEGEELLLLEDREIFVIL
jgi:chaperonin GroES